ncbi:AMMECR1 domain-containing protein [Tribonema minus]|uniref:AMMECR1 domain-containing protein n=1 Tax=Tribonema minus TaxID=303371 RepID=A0A835Z3D6_9STRA|nr:AMMECR1 domain-containing protein [Tribonema minus]
MLNATQAAKEERRASAERLYEHHEEHNSMGATAVAASAAVQLQATPEMCAHCFDVILARLEGRAPPPPPFPAAVACPFFVTWEKAGAGGGTKRLLGGGAQQQRPPGYALRGCIGTLSPQPLARLADYACSSAFGDRRFRSVPPPIQPSAVLVTLVISRPGPIEEREVARLKCSVSLLVEYEDAQGVDDWEVGKHGIVISFADRHGWTKPQAIESLVRKAGFRGPVTAVLLAAIDVTRYQSSKCGLAYASYAGMRGAGGGGDASAAGWRRSVLPAAATAVAEAAASAVPHLRCKQGLAAARGGSGGRAVAAAAARRQRQRLSHSAAAV